MAQSIRAEIPNASGFWSRVDKDAEADGCWLWSGAQFGGDAGDRYGSFYVRGNPGRQVYAHRLSYELAIGPIPDGLHLDHLCCIRLCVNPAHLEPVTSRVNTLRGNTPAARNLAKTHCRNGHPLSGSNLYLTPDGRRRCRSCRRDFDRTRRRKAAERKGAAKSVAPGAATHGGNRE